MKKIGVLLLAAVMSISVMACGKDKVDEKNSETQAQAMENENEGVAEGIDLTYGKVINIVGNELEIKIGTLPEPEENSEEEAPAMGGDAVAAAPAQEMAPEDYELNYTGETLKVTVDSGIKIMNMGQKCSLANIKEGNVIGLLLDDPKAENPNVEEIQILY